MNADEDEVSGHFSSLKKSPSLSIYSGERIYKNINNIFSSETSNAKQKIDLNSQLKNVSRFEITGEELKRKLF